MTEIARSRTEDVRAALRVALSSVGIDQEVRSIRRRINTYESSHRGDVVTCTLEGGSKLRLLCKYGRSVRRNCFGLSRGLSYEAAVYRHLGDELGDAVPRFYGACQDPVMGMTWLFLEYLGEGWRLDWGPPEVALPHAGRTIASLHRRLSSSGLPRLTEPINRYDQRYFTACIDQAAKSAHWIGERASSIERLADEFSREMEILLTAPQTIIHGELTPHNILWIDDRSRILDWEEAAVGPGEIDLACVTDEWDPELVELTNDPYVRTRWPQGPPHDFPRALAAARLYWLLRWLGDVDEAEGEDWVQWIADHVNELDARRGVR